VLTDPRVRACVRSRYPNIEAYQRLAQQHATSGIELNYKPESIDATSCTLAGLRTVRQ